MARKWTVPATVVEIVDGDTVRMDLDLGWHITYRCRCRVVGINSPEMDTPEGVNAKAYAETLLKPDDEVSFTSHSLDKYGRPLGSITFGGIAFRDFGEEMIRDGHAVPMT